MTSVGIRYLTGHAVATTVTREKAEWPPHPGRVFMAMAAAYFETGGDESERKALEWLERQEYPRVSAGECHARTLVGVYVPVNDRATDIPAQKQERSFPTVCLENDTVFLIWTSDAPPEIRAALDTLCKKVTRIGHSSSLTQLWLESSPRLAEGDWLPSDQAANEAERMRVATQGTLAYLEREFQGAARANFAEAAQALETAKGPKKTQIKLQIAAQFPYGEPQPRHPQIARWISYIRNTETHDTAEKPLTGFFSAQSVIVLAQEQGQRMGIESTLLLTNALRNAAMKAAGDNVPEWLSGHSADGNPSKLPHLAFFPFPFVDAEHADGHILGIGIAVPRGIESKADFRRVIRQLLFHPTGEDKTISLWQRSYKDENTDKPLAWKCDFRRSGRNDSRVTLNVSRWTRASCLWASVTPVVLHHYPKKNRQGDVVEIVREAFISAGLPAPAKIKVQASSVFEGAGHVRDMPPFTEGGKWLCRYQTHIAVEFDQPVEGPVLIGRGRFRGYGLCKPMRSDENGQLETE